MMLKVATQNTPLAPTHPVRRQWPHRLVVVALILGGVLLTVWPVVQTAVADRRGSVAVVEYLQQVTAQEPEVRNAQLADARTYNQALRPEALYDPWGAAGQTPGVDHHAYQQQLALAGAMARVRIPQIEVDLPVYHDATEASMANGAGHLFGSSLPVGGAGTHAVIAAHTDYVGRTFFDRLPEVAVGQTFMIDVAGTTLTYQIEQILVVQPSQLEAVARLAGDHVTLVTCVRNPDGDLDRLLVRGTRVPDPDGAAGRVTTTSSTVPVSHVTSVQDWMWPRIIGSAAGLLVLAAMSAGWLRNGRRPARAFIGQHSDSGEAR